MNNISIYEILLVSVVLITNAIIILVSLVRTSNKLIGKSFAVFTFLVVSWVGNAFASELISNTEIRLLLVKVTYGSVLLSMPALVKFLVVLSDPAKKLSIKKNLMLIIPALFLVCLTILSNTIISGNVTTEQGFEVIFGALGFIFYLYVAVYLLLVLYLLISGYIKSSGKERISYQLVIFGILLFTATNIVVNVIIPLVSGTQEYYRFGNYSIIFFTAFTSYAIVAHKLFEIRTFSTAVLVLVINIFLLSRIFLSRSTPDLIVNIIISFVVTLGSFSLIKSVSNEIKRREEVEKLAQEKTQALAQLEQRNKNLATLQKISKLVLDEIDMKIMVQKILDEIPKQLDTTVGALLSLVTEGNMKAYAMTQNSLSEKISQAIGTDLEKYSYPIQKDFNKIHEALVSRELIHTDVLSEFVSPPIPKPTALILQKSLNIHHLIAVPLYSGVHPLGVILFAYKVPKDQLSERDVEMAQAIADDISLAIQRAEAFQKLKDANEYLAQMDKMKDEFISIASHELNTPLAAVEGYLSMILDEGMGKVDAKAREYLERAYGSSKRLADLIMDLLNVSRIEQGRVKMKFSKNNLYELAESVLHELQGKADAKKLKLTLEGKKEEVPETYCDPDRIREVFVNLVGNSIKYTEKGSIKIKIHGDHSKIVSEITDTGRGISAIDQKKLFQKFSQVKREIDEHQGTGLGLYISKNFVDIHKGRIYVVSEEGKGSTFAFELPITTEPPKQLEGAILESNISAPLIESGEKDVPSVITASKKPS